MKRKYVDGADKIERIFAGISREAAEGIAHALNGGAREIAERAKLLVPEDQGDLKEDIEIETTGVAVRTDQKAVVAKVIVGTRGETAESAFRAEFGRKASSDGHPGHAAQPFLFPAYWSLRKRVLGRVKRAINKAAKEVVRRG